MYCIIAASVSFLFFLFSRISSLFSIFFPLLSAWILDFLQHSWMGGQALGLFPFTFPSELFLFLKTRDERYDSGV
ncbi:uncharacterized protein BDV14DRAFT_139841 [Aspergillus stella-maris]|uniref:uncharacterized protein n=1 Tax=Aspergillus stella-maris TaxID=1810926 RepID=UPI003CCD5513